MQICHEWLRPRAKNPDEKPWQRDMEHSETTRSTHSGKSCRLHNRLYWPFAARQSAIANCLPPHPVSVHCARFYCGYSLAFRMTCCVFDVWKSSLDWNSRVDCAYFINWNRKAFIVLLSCLQLLLGLACVVIQQVWYQITIIQPKFCLSGWILVNIRGLLKS